MPPQLRPAQVGDIAEIARFQTNCWREAYRGIVPDSYLDRFTVSDREQLWRDRLESGARNIAIAEQYGDVVGVASWDDNARPRELSSLYVAADQRGTGLAAQLLNHAIGTNTAYLWVFEQNPRAQAFYRKHGFTFDGTRQIDPGTGIWELRFARAELADPEDSRVMVLGNRTREA
jgi:GNAT superfamily N-acetyltransferase